MQHPSLVLIAQGPLFLLGITSIGSSAFIQFDTINNPRDMFSSSLILSNILSRCSHCFNFDGVATSSLPTGIS